MWDWTTSILKAQVRGRRELSPGLWAQLYPSVPPMPTRCLPLPSLQHDDQQPVVF